MRRSIYINFFALFSQNIDSDNDQTAYFVATSLNSLGSASVSATCKQKQKNRYAFTNHCQITRDSILPVSSVDEQCFEIATTRIHRRFLCEKKIHINIIIIFYVLKQRSVTVVDATGRA
jgi:hypothetical protein